MILTQTTLKTAAFSHKSFNEIVSDERILCGCLKAEYLTGEGQDQQNNKELMNQPPDLTLHTLHSLVMPVCSL